MFSPTDLFQNQNDGMRRLSSFPGFDSTTEFRLFSIVFNVKPLTVYLLLDFNFVWKFYYLEKHKNALGKFVFHFGYLYAVVWFLFFHSWWKHIKLLIIVYFCTVHRQSERFVPFFAVDPYFAIVKRNVVRFWYPFLLFRPKVTV